MAVFLSERWGNPQQFLGLATVFNHRVCPVFSNGQTFAQETDCFVFFENLLENVFKITSLVGKLLLFVFG